MTELCELFSKMINLVLMTFSRKTILWYLISTICKFLTFLVLATEFFNVRMKIVPKFTDELLKRVHHLRRNNEFDLENQNTLESLRFLGPKIWDFFPDTLEGWGRMLLKIFYFLRIRFRIMVYWNKTACINL